MPEISQPSGRTETGEAKVFRDRGPFAFLEDGGLQGKKRSYAVAGVEVGVFDEWEDKEYGKRGVFGREDDIKELFQG